MIDSPHPASKAHAGDDDQCLADTLRRLSQGPEPTRFSPSGDAASALFVGHAGPSAERWKNIHSYSPGQSRATSWLPADVPALVQQLQQRADAAVRTMVV